MAEGQAEAECLLSQCARGALHRADNGLYGRFVFGMTSELALVSCRPGSSRRAFLCRLGHFSLPVRRTRNSTGRISTARGISWLDAAGSCDGVESAPEH